MVLTPNVSNKPEGQRSAQHYCPHEFSLHSLENNITTCIYTREKLLCRFWLLRFGPEWQYFHSFPY